jgi:MFS family permease
MDSLGAIVGPVLAAPLIVAVGYRWLFAVSVIPELLATLAVLCWSEKPPASLTHPPCWPLHCGPWCVARGRSAGC